LIVLGFLRLRSRFSIRTTCQTLLHRVNHLTTTISSLEVAIAMPEEEEFPQETLDRLTFMRVHSIHGLMIGAFIYSSHPRPTVFTHPFQFSNKIEPKSRHRLGRIRGFFGKNTDDLKEPLQFSNVSQIKLAEMYWPSTKLEPFFSAILSEGKPFSRLRDLYLAYDRQLRAIPPPMVEQILPFFCAAPLEKIVTCEFFGLQLLDGLEQPQKLKSYKLLRPNDLLFKDTLQETVKWIASIFDRCPHLQLFQLPFEKHKQSITDSFLSVFGESARGRRPASSSSFE
jgi:hypothetical protein